MMIDRKDDHKREEILTDKSKCTQMKIDSNKYLTDKNRF